MPMFDFVKIEDLIGYAGRTFSSISPVLYLIVGISLAFFLAYGLFRLFTWIRDY